MRFYAACFIASVRVATTVSSLRDAPHERLARNARTDPIRRGSSGVRGPGAKKKTIYSQRRLSKTYYTTPRRPSRSPPQPPLRRTVYYFADDRDWTAHVFPFSSLFHFSLSYCARRCVCVCVCVRFSLIPFFSFFTLLFVIIIFSSIARIRIRREYIYIYTRYNVSVTATICLFVKIRVFVRCTAVAIYLRRLFTTPRFFSLDKSLFRVLLGRRTQCARDVLGAVCFF